MTGNTALDGKTVSCYHIQLDHNGDVLNTQVIEKTLRSESSYEAEAVPETSTMTEATPTQLPDLDDSPRLGVDFTDAPLPPAQPLSILVDLLTTAIATTTSTTRTTLKPSTRPKETTISTSFPAAISATTTSTATTTIALRPDDKIVFPTEDTSCSEVKENTFISWATGRLEAVPDFIAVNSVSECQEECSRREACVAWNFHPSYGCNLKASIENEVLFEGWSSGKKCAV